MRILRLCSIAVLFATGDAAALRMRGQAMTMAAVNMVLEFCKSGPEALAICTMNDVVKIEDGPDRIVCVQEDCANARVTREVKESTLTSEEENGMIEDMERLLEGGDEAALNSVENILVVRMNDSPPPSSESAWAESDVANGGNGVLHIDGNDNFDDAFGEGSRLQIFSTSSNVDEGSDNDLMFELIDENSDESIFNFVEVDSELKFATLKPGDISDFIDHNPVELDFVAGLEEAQKAADVNMKALENPDSDIPLFEVVPDSEFEDPGEDGPVVHDNFPDDGGDGEIPGDGDIGGDIPDFIPA